jgi:UDP-N-acetylmuramate dehydrogenase
MAVPHDSAGRPAEGADDIKRNVPLKLYTTFKIGGPARYFAEVGAPDELGEALDFARAEHLDLFVLGGGSNILVSDRGFAGLVLHPVNRGIAVRAEDADTVLLEIQAAEVWDDVVAYTVERGWWGIENLSHIPGQTGAAVVQNIGAYGQQLSDVLEAVNAVDLETGQTRALGREECGLSYRKSMFNSTARGRLLITSITLRLKKRGAPNLSYADVRNFFSDCTGSPAQREIREAIIAIRDRKFPFPREEKGGNAGSFFKNLTLSEDEYQALEKRMAAEFGPAELERLRELRKRFAGREGIKIPTAFLMEICGLKGLRVGEAQVNETQPLVLLNLGGATARDVMSLAKDVRHTLHARAAVVVNLEPELVGFSHEEVRDYLGLEGS